LKKGDGKRTTSLNRRPPEKKKKRDLVLEVRLASHPRLIPAPREKGRGENLLTSPQGAREGGKKERKICVSLRKNKKERRKKALSGVRVG